MSYSLELSKKQLLLLLGALVLIGLLTFLAGLLIGIAASSGEAPADEASAGATDETGGTGREAAGTAERQRIYELQFSAHLDRKSAQPALDTLTGAGYQPFIVETRDSRGQSLFTVRIGPWDTMEQAAQAAQSFTESGGAEGMQPVIRYRPKPVMPTPPGSEGAS